MEATRAFLCSEEVLSGDWEPQVLFMFPTFSFCAFWWHHYLSVISKVSFFIRAFTSNGRSGLAVNFVSSLFLLDRSQAWTKKSWQGAQRRNWNSPLASSFFCRFLYIFVDSWTGCPKMKRNQCICTRCCLIWSFPTTFSRTKQASLQVPRCRCVGGLL